MTTTPTTDDALLEVIEALDKATPGPWVPTLGHWVKQEHGVVVAQPSELRGPQQADNADAIALSVNFLRTHADTIRRALDALKRVEEAAVGFVIGQSGPDFLGPQTGAIVQMDDPASIKGQRVALVRVGEG